MPTQTEKKIKRQSNTVNQEVIKSNAFYLLPDEIIIYIFSLLTNDFISHPFSKFKEYDFLLLSQLQLVSKRFCELARDNRLWKTLFPCSLLKNERVNKKMGWYNSAIKNTNFLRYITNHENYPPIGVEEIEQDPKSFNFQLTDNTTMVLIRLGLLSLQHAPKEWKDDTDIVQRAVNAFGLNIEHATSRLKSHRDTVTIALSHDGNAFKHISKDLQNDKELLLLAIDCVNYFEPDEGHILQYASPRLRADEEVAWAATKADGLAYAHLSDELKKNKDILYTAIDNNLYELNHVLEFAPDDFRNDKAIALYAVKHQGESLSCLPDNLKNDREVVVAATLQNAQAIDYIGHTLQEDRDIVMAALVCPTNKEGCHGDGLLENAHSVLKNDAEIILAAIEHYHAREIKYASERLLADRNFLLRAYLLNKEVSKYLIPPAFEQLKSAVKIYAKHNILHRVSKDGCYLEKANSFNTDKDVVLAAVEQNGCALQYASIELRSNIDIVHAAVKQSANAIKHASMSLLSDMSFIIGLVEVKCEALYCLPQNIKDDIMNTPEKKNALATQIMLTYQGPLNPDMPFDLSLDWDGYEQIESLVRQM